jgi:hypothetical protein
MTIVRSTTATNGAGYAAPGTAGGAVGGIETPLWRPA